MSKINKVLYVSGKDIKTEALSIVGNIGFIDDGFYWPTIKHYVLAKRFEGTEFEHIIRRATTDFELDFLTTPIYTFVNDDFPHYENVFIGKNTDDQYSKFYMRLDAIKNDQHYIKKAIELKFEQHPYLLPNLIDTQGYTIVEPGQMDISKWLIKFRDKKINQLKKDKNKNNKLWIDYRDISISIKKNKYIIDVILETVAKSTISGPKIIGPSMITDAIVNICVNGIDNFKFVDDKIPDEMNDILNKTTKWIDHLDWNKVYVDMPHFNKLLIKIGKIVKKTKFKFDNRDRVSAYISSFIRWINLIKIDASSSSIRSSFFKKIRVPKKLLIKKKVVEPLSRDLSDNISDDLLPIENNIDQELDKLMETINIKEDESVKLDSDTSGKVAEITTSPIENVPISKVEKTIQVYAPGELKVTTVGERIFWYNYYLTKFGFSNEKYSIVTTCVEDMQSKKRDAWINDFEISTIDIQTSMINILIDEKKCRDARKSSGKKTSKPKKEPVVIGAIEEISKKDDN